MSDSVFKRRAWWAIALALVLAPVFAHAQADQSDQLTQLSSALSPDLKDVKIDASAADLAAGKPTKAQLTLPAGLLDRVQNEAGKLGLRRSARHVSVTARLSGQGYQITPAGDQTAELQPGQASVAFTWQVTPSGPGKAPLTADVTGQLTGAATPQYFPLAQLSVDVAPAQTTAMTPQPGPQDLSLERLKRISRSAMARLKTMTLSDLWTIDLDVLQIPGHKTVTIPGVGTYPSQQLVAGAIVLVIVIVLWAIARNAAERKRKAERRRRFRTFEATSFGQEPGHEA
jgi:hypothetical protein